MGAWELCRGQSQNTGESVPQGSTGREVIQQGAPRIAIELSNIRRWKVDDEMDVMSYEWLNNVLYFNNSM